MREILFRGKRIDNGEWVESGSPARIGNDGVHWEIYLGAGKAAEHDLDEHGNILASVTLEECLFYKVDPSTVGQYTGLTDKNGNRIFEGDVVESADFTEEDGYGVVEWDDGAWEVGNGEWCGTFHENYYGKEFEVIGNIHDNPELLKEEAHA